jgi:hypothetical protein
MPAKEAMPSCKERTAHRCPAQATSCCCLQVAADESRVEVMLLNPLDVALELDSLALLARWGALFAAAGGSPYACWLAAMHCSGVQPCLAAGSSAAWHVHSGHNINAMLSEVLHQLAMPLSCPPPPAAPHTCHPPGTRTSRHQRPATRAAAATAATAPAWPAQSAAPTPSRSPCPRAESPCG